VLRERVGLIQVGGREATVVGEDLQVDDPAPEFRVHSTEWEEVDALESTHGHVRIIASLPFLDTAVCDRETRTFNRRAVELGPDV
jgi:thiol peroxidase